MSITKGVDLGHSELIDVGKLIIPAINNKYANNTYSGIRRAKILGQGMDFDQIRQYQFGDDIRSIDWKSSARLQKTYIKTYREERQRPVFLLIDLSASMLFASKKRFKSVIAAKIGVLFGFLALKFDDKIGLVIYSQNQHFEIKPKTPKSAIKLLIGKLVEIHQKALADISRVQNTSPNTLNFALSRLNRANSHGSLVVIISDFFNFDTVSKTLVQKLSKHNKVQLNFIYDPLEKTPPKTDFYLVNNDGQRQKMNLQNRHNRKIYNNFFVDKLDFLTQFSKNNKIELTPISTTIDLKDLSINF